MPSRTPSQNTTAPDDDGYVAWSAWRRLQVYYPHTSWYSWVLSSLADAVYLLGFIGMCPQLYINYKLKSVAHMPWRVLAYKARLAPPIEHGQHPVAQARGLT